MKKQNFCVVNSTKNSQVDTKEKEACKMVQCDDRDSGSHNACTRFKRLPEPHVPLMCVKCTIINEQLRKFKEMKPVPAEVSNILERLTEALNVQNDHQAKRAALIKLPVFEGQPKDWPKFKRMFEETTRECKFSNIENLHRLQQAVKGRAKYAIRPLMLDSANVEAILERLEECFGRPELVYAELVKDVRRVKVPDLTGIPGLAYAVENLVANMKALGHEEYLNDPWLVAELVRKLPFSSQIEFCTAKPSMERPLNLNDLNEWLKPLASIISSW